MEYKDSNVIAYKIYEDKSNSNGTQAVRQLDADIQVAYLNMLHEKGLLPDDVHSIALNKVTKGVL